MNAEPHTHDVEIDREYGSAGGHYTVTYGDTTVRVKRWWWPAGCFWTSHPSEAFIKRHIDWAIRQHDEGSRAAGSEQQTLDRIKASYANQPGRWAGGDDVPTEGSD